MASNTKNVLSVQTMVWPVTVIISLFLGYVLLKPFLGVTALGLLLAFIFYPLFQWIYKKTSKKGLSVTLTTISSLLLIGIPLVLIFIITAVQAVNLANDLANSDIFVGQENFVDGIEEAAITANEKIETLVGIESAIDEQDIDSFIRSTLPEVARAVGNLVLGIVGGIPNFFTMLIVYLFVFTAGLSYGPQLRKTVEELSPFDKETNARYIQRLGSMAKAMLKGQMLIALMQGLVSAAVISFVGFGGYFWVMAVLFTFMSFIPLGAGIITIPLGIVMMLLGDISGGLIVLLNHFLVITNIDNVVRPKVVPKDASLPAVLTILAAFGGVAMFGLIGVIYGPMIMIFVTTTIDSYLEHKRKIVAQTT